MVSAEKYISNSPLPTEDDPRSDQQRILDSLAAAGVEERVHITVHILRKLYPLLDNAKWKITVSLAWNGENWEMVEIEEGDTTAQHYGLAVDLGSTTVVARLLDCNSGEILKRSAASISRSSGGQIFCTGFFTVKIIGKSWKKCGGLRWNPYVNVWISWMTKPLRALHGNRAASSEHYYDSLPSGNGRFLRLLYPTRSPCRSPQLPAGVRSGHSAERLRLLLPCRVELPWWRYYQRHD